VSTVRDSRERREVSATGAVLAVLRTSSRLLEELEPVFAAHGTTASRFDVLDALSKCGGRGRPAELREALHLPAQTVTGVIDQLEGGGLVRRLPNPIDRRSVLVEITSAGRAAVDRICRPLIEVEEDCMAGLSQTERRRLAELLAKVEARITHRRAVSPR
jgi:DNA-binding MarR family transcriptional regulator